MKKVNLLKIFILSFSFLIIIGLSVFFYYIKDLPRPEVFTENEINQATKIYDRKG